MLIKATIINERGKLFKKNQGRHESNMDVLRRIFNRREGGSMMKDKNN